MDSYTTSIQYLQSSASCRAEVERVPQSTRYTYTANTNKIIKHDLCPNILSYIESMIMTHLECKKTKVD